jgi:hypothetical protein
VLGVKERIDAPLPKRKCRKSVRSGILNDMRCPGCDNEMNHGTLTCDGLSWNTKKDNVLKRWLGLGPLVKNKNSSSRIDAFHCQSCKIMLITNVTFK